MTLPAFASVDDLNARLPGGVRDADAARAQAALDDASTLIRAEARRNWVDDDNELDLPDGDDAWRADIIKRVCLGATLRAFQNPETYNQETANTGSIDIYLTRGEKRLIRKAAALTGLGAIPVSRSDLGTTGTPYGLETARTPDGGTATYIDVEPAPADPIPWVGPDGF